MGNAAKSSNYMFIYDLASTFIRECRGLRTEETLYRCILQNFFQMYVVILKMCFNLEVNGKIIFVTWYTFDTFSGNMVIKIRV